MVSNSNLLSSLLRGTEDNLLDFKQRQYKFETERQKSGFIKDIISMANTPREFSAYIVVGVVEQGGRPTQIVGVSDHFDPSELDRQMEGRVNCVPSISYHVVDHEGHEVGIYEVRADPRGPFVALRKFGRLDPGAIYFRRNSQNAVATNRQDIERITAWFTGVESSAPPQPAATMSWQQFYRVCDGFDESRSYICVIDEKVHATIDDWRSFAAFGWDLVIDFDVDTDESGAFSKSRETLRGCVRSSN